MASVGAMACCSVGIGAGAVAGGGSTGSGGGTAVAFSRIVAVALSDPGARAAASASTWPAARRTVGSAPGSRSATRYDTVGVSGVGSAAGATADVSAGRSSKVAGTSDAAIVWLDVTAAGAGAACAAAAGAATGAAAGAIATVGSTATGAARLTVSSPSPLNQEPRQYSRSRTNSNAVW